MITLTEITDDLITSVSKNYWLFPSSLNLTFSWDNRRR